MIAEFIHSLLGQHEYELIKEVRLTGRPQKLVRDTWGEPIVADYLYGHTVYLYEDDFSKPIEVEGFEYHYHCKGCGNLKIVSS